MLAKAPGRPNPIARLPGNGIAGPLLIQGPVDVVPASQERWQHPPFGGYLVDGFLWGLGSLDMKSGIAMMPHAILRGKTDGMTPGGDIVLATVSDEESGGDQVARYLVEDRQELFAGIKYALGEGGGFGFQMGGAAVLPNHGRRQAGLLSSGDLPGDRRPRVAGHTTQPNDRYGPVTTAGNSRPR